MQYERVFARHYYFSIPVDGGMHMMKKHVERCCLGSRADNRPFLRIPLGRSLLAFHPRSSTVGVCVCMSSLHFGRIVEISDDEFWDLGNLTLSRC